MAINTIIFDLGNVVVAFDIRIIARKLSKQFPLDEDKLFDLFFDSELVAIHDEGKIDSREFHKKAEVELSIKITFDEFKDIWNDIFTENKEVSDLVEGLSQKYKVYLMSNTNKMHFDYIRDRFPIIQKFDKIFTSYEVGVRKPHPKIYNEAISYSGSKPEEIVFIDDRLELTDGAQKLGIRGIQFSGIGKLKEELIKEGVKL